MRTVTANEAKSHFGTLLDDARDAPVAITKHGKRTAVVISAKEYEAYQEAKLARLRMEVQIGLDELESGKGERYSARDVSRLAADISARGMARRVKS